jgi:hypothetical protein
MRKKSPAQGGPARGSSAPGLGGKNERAEPNKHGCAGLVPSPLDYFRREALLKAYPIFIHKKWDIIPVLPGDFRQASDKRPALAAGQCALA